MGTGLREGQALNESADTDGPFDLLVIGGGINGAGIARDAAGRGLSVVLAERDDLGSATSSASSKLIHGGLRYLEQFDFGLVRKALAEREVLLRIAPHIVRPMEFVLPHDRTMRPAWLIGAGLWLYDHLARRVTLPASRRLDLRAAPQNAPLSPRIAKGFSYADGWVDDARLVLINALDAQARGARILTRTEFVSAEQADGLWRAQLRDLRSGRPLTVTSRAVVNAAGPWVDRVSERMGETADNIELRLVKGSHIVVPRLYEGPQAYLLQTGDGRVVFVIPFEGDYSLIGTTDVPVTAGPEAPTIEKHEIDYLCEAVNCYFEHWITPKDVVWTFSGLRPLLDDGAADPSDVTRDYRLAVSDRGAPAITVIGGKITTYRRLAEETLALFSPNFPDMGSPWTADAVLPGGEPIDIAARWPWLNPGLAARYKRQYGSETAGLLGDATGMADLGPDFGAGLHEREIAYLRTHEWAETSEDILWRRTKLGLRLATAEIEALEAYLKREIPAVSPLSPEML